MMYNDEIRHYQIRGAVHGVRRFQNPDGSLTPAGRERYLKGGKKTAKVEVASAKAAKKPAAAPKAAKKAKPASAPAPKAAKPAKENKEGVVKKITSFIDARKRKKQEAVQLTRDEWTKTKDSIKEHWHEMTNDERAASLTTLSLYDSFEELQAKESNRQKQKIDKYVSMLAVPKKITEIAADAAKIYATVYESQMKATKTQKEIDALNAKQAADKKNDQTQQIMNVANGVLSALQSSKQQPPAKDAKDGKKDKKPSKSESGREMSDEEYKRVMDAVHDETVESAGSAKEAAKAGGSGAVDYILKNAKQPTAAADKAAKSKVEEKKNTVIWLTAERGEHADSKDIPKDSGWGADDWRAKCPDTYKPVSKDGDILWVPKGLDADGNIELKL